VDSTAIPWLRLGAVISSGPGVLDDTTYIQRVNTVGGIAPPPLLHSSVTRRVSPTQQSTSSIGQSNSLEVWGGRLMGTAHLNLETICRRNDDFIQKSPSFNQDFKSPKIRAGRWLVALATGMAA